MVEARTLSESNAVELEHWCEGRIVTQHDPLDYDSTTLALNVPTSEGVQRAQIGDTVIREDDGSFRITKVK